MTGLETSRALTSLRLALGLLTVIAVNTGRVTPSSFGRSLVWFPAVGALVGGAQWLLAELAAHWLSSGVVATLVVALSALLSGGLHLDGVADSCDAAGGGRGDRARSLEILRDSRIGAHGATGLILLLLAKVVATADLVEASDFSSLLLAPALGRFGATPLLAFLPAARPGGLGSVFGEGARGGHVVGAGLLLLGLMLALGRLPALELAAAALGTAAVARWALRRLGGMTGDVCGACIELAELGALIAASARLG